MAEKAKTGRDLIEQAALSYLARGWSLVPLRPREKRPLIRWEALQKAAPSPARVKGWFKRWPDANIGVITGKQSGLIVVDIDPHHGGDDSLKELERQFGPLPLTPEARSGGGGRHLYFHHPGGTLGNRAGIRPGIDLRGDGGYIVASPSIHPNGQTYRWIEGRRPDDLPLAILPAWARGEDAPGIGHGPTHWRDLVTQGVGEGARNQTIASLTGHLLWHGVDARVALELLLAWNRVRCRPPLDDREVASVVQSIERTHARHKMEAE